MLNYDLPNFEEIKDHYVELWYTYVELWSSYSFSVEK